jgi:hypothetical protein
MGIDIALRLGKNYRGSQRASGREKSAKSRTAKRDEDSKEGRAREGHVYDCAESPVALPVLTHATPIAISAAPPILLFPCAEKIAINDY